MTSSGVGFGAGLGKEYVRMHGVGVLEGGRRQSGRCEKQGTRLIYSRSNMNPKVSADVR